MTMREAPNPFEPPKSEWVEDHHEGALDEWVDAGQGVRFMNNVFDTLILAVIGAAMSSVGNEWIDILLPMLVTFVYYAGFEAAFGRTPAKWITRSSVVTTAGLKPRVTQILGRTLVRFVPFEAFSFLSGRFPRGWHDRWSGTRVVKDGGLTGRWKPPRLRTRDSSSEFE
jgi:uncharacterized RDD family membrane protein YckC